MFKNTKLRVIVAASAVSAIALGAFGFAAGNTIDDHKVGTGDATVSGYTVSNVEYVFDAADPTAIDGVNFTLDTVAELVKVSLDGGNTWVTCDSTTVNVTCVYTDYDSALVTALHVFATDSAAPVI